MAPHNPDQPSKRKKANGSFVDVIVDPTQLHGAERNHVLQKDNLIAATIPNTTHSACLTTHMTQSPSLPSVITLKETPSAVVSHQTTLTVPGINIDMSLTKISDPNFRHIISQCIKQQVFRKCKFYNKEHHGAYNEKPSSFCGIVLKYCHIVGNPQWWYDTRKMIVVTHTNHRNNCIKAMKTKFGGKLYYANEPKARYVCISNRTNILCCANSFTFRRMPKANNKSTIGNATPELV